MTMKTNSFEGGVTLPAEVSTTIWQGVQEKSAVMTYGTRLDLPGKGLTVPMITGDPSASWAGEGQEIAVGDSTVDLRHMSAHKVGVIETFSKEMKRDLPALVVALQARLPGVIAAEFDRTVLHGANGYGPVNQSTFDSLRKAGVGASVLTSADAYDDLVDIDAKVSVAGGSLNAYLLSPQARGVLLRAKDTDGRPLLVNNVQTDGAVTGLLGVDAFRTTAAFAKGAEDDVAGNTIAIAGDFTSLYFGVVQDIEVEISTDATVVKNGTPINLFQSDLFAVKVTAHLGSMIRKGHENRFVRITDGVVVNEVA